MIMRRFWKDFGKRFFLQSEITQNISKILKEYFTRGYEDNIQEHLLYNDV